MSIKMVVKDRRFAPLFWTQFLGALNDNIFKNALVLIITYRELRVAGLDKATVVALAGGLFILPFLLFSHIAGQLADKMEKARLVRITKYWEVAIMALAALGFHLHRFELLLVVLFMAGVQAALFGPVKYSALPDLVPSDQLVSANAFVEAGTFLAILLGTLGGGMLVDQSETVISIVLLSLAGLGVVTAWRLPRLEPHAPGLRVRFNPYASFRDLYQCASRERAVFMSVLGQSWFWFFGASVMSILPVYCKDMLFVDAHVVTCFLAVFTIGIGAGSFLCNLLSLGRIELGLVPIGTFGMSAFLFDLYLARPDWLAEAAPVPLSIFLASWAGWRLLGDFFFMCLFSGLFILPLATMVQERSRPEERSRVLAANNIMNSLYMVVASVLVMAFNAASLSFPQMFLCLSILNLIAAIYMYTVVPEFTLRFLAWVAARMIYRIRLDGESNIPARGGVLLVCNHVSYIDWLVIFAMIHRPVRFVMHYKFWNIPIVQRLMTRAGVIPIAGQKENPEVFQAAFARVSEALRAGEVVCIFPEGHITRDGIMQPFRRGVEHILAKDPVPVLPMRLIGLWGTWFSFSGGRALLKTPRHWMERVSLRIGPAFRPEEATAARLEEAVRGLEV